MSYASSGAKVTSSLINGIFPAILSSAFTQRTFQGAGGTVTGTTFGNVTTQCTTTVTSAGSFAFIVISALLAEDTAGHIGRGAVAISGATTTAASTTGEFFLQTTQTTAQRFTAVGLMPINPGANTYTLQYLTTPSGSTLTVTSQSILVIAP